MKKILILSMLLSVSLFAKKPYFVMVASSNCQVCIETMDMINHSREIQTALKQYTDFSVISKEEALSAGLRVRTTPTFFFFAKEKKALLVEPLRGKPENIQEFSQYIEDVYIKYNEFAEHNIKKK